MREETRVLLPGSPPTPPTRYWMDDLARHGSVSEAGASQTVDICGPFWAFFPSCSRERASQMACGGVQFALFCVLIHRGLGLQRNTIQMSYWESKIKKTDRELKC